MEITGFLQSHGIRTTIAIFIYIKPTVNRQFLKYVKILVNYRLISIAFGLKQLVKPYKT